MDGLLELLTVLAALGCGVCGGVFFAFSTFVMHGLGRLAPTQGPAAMQAINVSAVSAVFMLALFGAAAACAVLAGWAAIEWDSSHSPYLLAGAGLYLAGVIGMTVAFHVPRNDALAAVAPASRGAAEAWSRYLRQWTAGNHVRTIAGLAAALSFTVALL